MMFRIAPASLAVLAIFNVASTFAAGNWAAHITVEPLAGVISDARFDFGEHGSGCGRGNAKCYCQVPTVGANAGELVMVGAGSDGAATGLDFSCLFRVQKENSPPGSAVECRVHVDIPFVGDNRLTCSCPGHKFFGCDISASGHIFTKVIALSTDKQSTAIFAQEMQPEKSTAA